MSESPQDQATPKLHARYRLTVLSTLLVILAICPAAFGQTDPTLEAGIIPFRSYSPGQFDKVDTLNGNVVIHIPLVSFPQRGGVGLSFSLIANSSNGWTIKTTCAKGGVSCTTTNGRPWGSLGPRLIEDHYAAPLVGVTSVISGYAYTTADVIVKDATGATHPMGFDASNPAYVRSTDGSGYMFVPANPSLYDQPTASSDGILYTSDGIERTFGINGGIDQQLQSMSDPDGNKIAYSLTSAPNSAGALEQTGGSYTDSMGRVISDEAYAILQELYDQVPSNSTAGCPSVGALNQPLFGSILWSVPGPNGTTQTYQFCFASVYESYTVERPTGTTTSSVPLLALQSVILPNNTYWAFIYDSANPSGSGTLAYGDLLEVVTPTGGSVSYTFAPESTCPEYSSASTRSVVTRTTNDGQGHLFNWSYSYSPGLVTTPTATTTITDPLNEQTVFNYEALQTGSCTLYEMSRQVYAGTTGSSPLLSSVSTSYQYASNPQGALQSTGWLSLSGVFPTKTVTTLDGKSTTETTTQYDSGFMNEQPVCTALIGGSGQSCSSTSYADGQYAPVQIPLGMTTSQSVYGYGSGSPGALLRTTNTSYLASSNSAYLDQDLLNLPTSIQVVNGSGAQAASTQYQYDQSGYVASTSSPLGHRTTISKWITGSTYATSNLWWNSTGTLGKTIDPNQACQTTYGYSSTYNGAYPTSVTNCLNQTTSYQYDFNIGQLTQVTDSNNQLAYYTHDELGRLKAVTYPDGASTTYTYNDGASPVNVQVSQAINSTTNKQMQINIDGFGRQIATKLLSDPYGTDEVDTSYDSLGRVASASNPYRSTSDPTYGITAYTYDAIGRPLLECEPDNGTSKGACSPGNSYTQRSYNGNVTTSYDQNRNSWQYSTDALGRLTAVVEPGALQTTYSYNALGDLLCVDQWGAATVGGACSSGTHRSFSYDSLSRLLIATNPETGPVTYSYDANGNVHKKTDARSITTTFGYDALNRLVSKTYANDPSGSPASCYLYDTTTSGTGSNVISRLTAEWTQKVATGSSCPSSPSAPITSRTVSAYDSVGRVKSETQCVGSSCSIDYPWTTTYSYDLAGNLVTYGNLAGTTLFTNSYNSAGQLCLVSTAGASTCAQGATPSSSNLFSNPIYAPHGALSGSTYGTSLTLTRTFDNRLRITGETDTGTVGVSPAVPGAAQITITGGLQ